MPSQCTVPVIRTVLAAKYVSQNNASISEMATNKHASQGPVAQLPKERNVLSVKSDTPFRTASLRNANNKRGRTRCCHADGR